MLWGLIHQTDSIWLRSLYDTIRNSTLSRPVVIKFQDKVQVQLSENAKDSHKSCRATKSFKMPKKTRSSRWQAGKNQGYST